MGINKQKNAVRAAFCFLFVMQLFFPLLCLADDLKLSIRVPSGSFSKAVTIRSQPTPFTVILTNHSSSAQSIYWKANEGAIVNLSFEFSEEGGGSFVVKRKPKQFMSTTVISNYLAAGASVDKTIVADPETWENVPVIESGKVKKYQVRAVYDNEGQTIRSDYYTVIFDGGA